jgi:hypothetical protein
LELKIFGEIPKRDNKALADTLSNHLENIINYFDNRLTKVIWEGLNNLGRLDCNIGFLDY